MHSLAHAFFIHRLVAVIPPERKHRHHGAFALNHPLRPDVTAMAFANVGEQREAVERMGRTAEKPCSHDTSRIAWTKLPARVGEEFPLGCPNCGCDVWLISFITQPGPIRKILEHVGEPLEPPHVSPTRGRPVAWDALVQAAEDHSLDQASIDDLATIDNHRR